MAEEEYNHYEREEEHYKQTMKQFENEPSLLEEFVEIVKENAPMTAEEQQKVAEHFRQEEINSEATVSFLLNKVEVKFRASNATVAAINQDDQKAIEFFNDRIGKLHLFNSEERVVFKRTDGRLIGNMVPEGYYWVNEEPQKRKIAKRKNNVCKTINIKKAKPVERSQPPKHIYVDGPRYQVAKYTDESLKTTLVKVNEKLSDIRPRPNVDAISKKANLPVLPTSIKIKLVSRPPETQILKQFRSDSPETTVTKAIMTKDTSSASVWKPEISVKMVELLVYNKKNNLGPAKHFKNNVALYRFISKTLNTEFNVEISDLQVKGHFEIIIKAQKKYFSECGQSGAAGREKPKYWREFEILKHSDDSVEPTFILGVGKIPQYQRKTIQAPEKTNKEIESQHQQSKKNKITPITNNNDPTNLIDNFQKIFQKKEAARLDNKEALMKVQLDHESEERQKDRDNQLKMHKETLELEKYKIQLKHERKMAKIAAKSTVSSDTTNID